MTTPATPEQARKRRHRNERIAAAVLVVIAIGITLVVVWWERRVDEEFRADTTYVPKPETITPEILLLREYVRIDTSTPAGAADGARWLAAHLAKHGVQPEIIESAPGRLNVYARVRGRRPGNGLLLFNHIDVVPPGDKKWYVPPFEARISVNQIWGRGVLDMKGLALCQLLAFLDVARSPQPPAHDVVFLATADEETGSEFGMQWIIAHRPDVLEGVRYGITEGGITEMKEERVTYFGVEIGGKQAVELTIEGDDVESIRRTRIALEPFIFPRDPDRVLPAVQQYFKSLAPTRIAFQPQLEDVDRAIREGTFWQLPAPYRDLTQNAVWASAPIRRDRWQMDVKLLNLPDEDPDARLRWLSTFIAPYGTRIAAIRSKTGPVPLSSADSLLFSLLVNEAKRRYDTDAGIQILYRSASDARFLRPLGIQCYGISPYPVDFYQSISIHQANERLRLGAFTQGVEYLRQVVAAWSRDAG